MRRILLLLIIMSIGAFASNAQPYRYYFNNTFAEVGGSGPTLTEVLSCGATAGNFSIQTITTDDGPCGSGDQYAFNFNEGGGISFPNSNLIGGNYTIHMFFKFNTLSGFQRLIDFSDGAVDDGLYILDDCLTLYPIFNTGPCPFFQGGNFYLISLVRNSGTQELRVLVNGVLFGSIIDNADQYVPTTTTTPIVFFRDDASFGCEDRDGSIKYLSLSTTTSTDQDVLDLWNTICAISLPLQLKDFTANKQAGDVQLKWTTVNESAVSHFEIERSSNGASFASIGTVQAVNLASRNSYNFNDRQPLSGTSFYRLKMVDMNGEFKYSGIVKITSSGIQPFEIFPNPVKDVFTVSGMRNNEVLRLMDASGKELLRRMATGMSLTIDISQYPNGVYYLSYFDGEKMQTRKILKQ